MRFIPPQVKRRFELPPTTETRSKDSALYIVMAKTTAKDFHQYASYQWNKEQIRILKSWILLKGPWAAAEADLTQLLRALDLDGYENITNKDGQPVHQLILAVVRRQIRRMIAQGRGDDRDMEHTPPDPPYQPWPTDISDPLIMASDGSCYPQYTTTATTMRPGTFSQWETPSNMSVGYPPPNEFSLPPRSGDQGNGYRGVVDSYMLQNWCSSTSAPYFAGPGFEYGVRNSQSTAVSPSQSPISTRPPYAPKYSETFSDFPPSRSPSPSLFACPDDLNTDTTCCSEGYPESLGHSEAKL